MQDTARALPRPCRRRDTRRLEVERDRTKNKEETHQMRGGRPASCHMIKASEVLSGQDSQRSPLCTATPAALCFTAAIKPGRATRALIYDFINLLLLEPLERWRHRSQQSRIIAPNIFTSAQRYKLPRYRGDNAGKGAKKTDTGSHVASTMAHYGERSGLNDTCFRRTTGKTAGFDALL